MPIYVTPGQPQPLAKVTTFLVQAVHPPEMPPERVQAEIERLWKKHCAEYGEPKAPDNTAPPPPVEYFTARRALREPSIIPPDIIGPRLLTLALGIAATANEVGFEVKQVVRRRVSVLHEATIPAVLCHKRPPSCGYVSDSRY